MAPSEPSRTEPSGTKSASVGVPDIQVTRPAPGYRHPVRRADAALTSAPPPAHTKEPGP